MDKTSNFVLQVTPETLKAANSKEQGCKQCSGILLHLSIPRCCACLKPSYEQSTDGCEIPPSALRHNARRKCGRELLPDVTGIFLAEDSERLGRLLGCNISPGSKLLLLECS